MMVEWHVTPDYIVNHWTEELLNLMIEKMMERKQAGLKESKPAQSEELLFSRAGIKRVDGSITDAH